MLSISKVFFRAGLLCISCMWPWAKKETPKGTPGFETHGPRFIMKRGCPTACFNVASQFVPCYRIRGLAQFEKPDQISVADWRQGIAGAWENMDPIASSNPDQEWGLTSMLKQRLSCIPSPLR